MHKYDSKVLERRRWRGKGRVQCAEETCVHHQHHTGHRPSPHRDQHTTRDLQNELLPSTKSVDHPTRRTTLIPNPGQVPERSQSTNDHQEGLQQNQKRSHGRLGIRRQRRTSVIVVRRRAEKQRRKPRKNAITSTVRTRRTTQVRAIQMST